MCGGKIIKASRCARIFVAWGGDDVFVEGRISRRCRGGWTARHGSRSDRTNYRLCALREGARGPCTCEVKGGVPGEYVTAPRSRCRPAPAAQKPDTAAVPTAAGAAPAVNPLAAPQLPTAAPKPSVIETGGLPGSRKVMDIRARGKLLCGINTDLLGFSKQTDTGSWIGLDVDFCRAVAAAGFGDAGKVEFVRSRPHHGSMR